jgi:hypothetical protein
MMCEEYMGQVHPLHWLALKIACQRLQFIVRMKEVGLDQSGRQEVGWKAGGSQRTQKA